MKRFNLFPLISVLVIVTVFLLPGCKKELSGETIVYNNDFEKSDLSSITNGNIDVFNGTHVLGRYFNGYFKLNLSSLPTHSQVNVSFDLYIHDSWDGNANFANNYVGPDIWKMSVDSATYIYTTFSNLACPVGFICPPQSYPQTYPATNNPRTGSYASLPGACLNKTMPDGTTLYKINKTMQHTSANLVLNCVDSLKENGVADKRCSESWSVDNLKITLVK